MSTNRASKKPKTATATAYKQNWFFTSPECVPKWHRLIGSQWFIEALNEKLSYANGNAAKNKLKSLLNFHDNLDVSQLTMPELDTAHMFVLTRNETTLGYFCCADVWKYDERSTGGSASPFVKMLEQKADLLITSAIKDSWTNCFEENDYLVNTNNSSWDMNGDGQNENLSMLAYAMIYNDHHHFLSVFLQDPRVLEVWTDSSNFNVWEMEESMDDGETHLGSTLLKQACEVDAYQSARLLVNFRHHSINSVGLLPAREGGLVFNPFDTCEFQSNGLNSTTSNGMSAVHIACWHGSIRTLRVLLDAPLFDGVVGRTHWQANKSAEKQVLPINRTNDNFYGWQQLCCSAMGITPLHAILLGARESNQNVRGGVQMLIEYGADVNAVSGPVTNDPPHQSEAVFCEGNGNRQCYMTPLHLASLTGDPLLVNMLLVAGASANAVGGHECLSFGKTTSLIFKPREHCIKKASYCSISPHRCGWTPTIMAVHSLSCEPTSSNRRAVAETLMTAMSSTSTLQFPPPTNEYDQGDWKDSVDESDKDKWNVEINYPKWIKRVDRDCPNVLQMFKPVEDKIMQGTEKDKATHEDNELTGIFSTPAVEDPNDKIPIETICLQLADVCQMRSEYDMAIALYQHVLLFPTHAKAAQCGIAEVHCHCGRLDDALTAFACIK
jgi:ankyrin repeat protein